MSTSSKYYYKTAKRGDTWDTLAFSEYGEERNATTIMKANVGMCQVIMFEGGEQIKIPIITKVNSPSTLPPWRRS